MKMDFLVKFAKRVMTSIQIILAKIGLNLFNNTFSRTTNNLREIKSDFNYFCNLNWKIKGEIEKIKKEISL